MARKVRFTQDDGDDAPEVVSRSVSKADAKRQEKALREFEAEEKARRKARNRERDQKLKERARVTNGGKSGEKRKKVRFAEVEEAGDESVDEKDDVEARMLRAMRDAADEVGGGEGEADDDDSDGDGDGDFMGFGQGMDLGDDIASGSDSSQDEDDEDAKMLMGEDDSIDLEALADDEAMDEDEEDDETTPLQSNIHRSNKKADYLADDIFAAAFASQNSKSTPKKSVQSTQQQTAKKRRRKSTARPKDLVVGYVMYFPDPIREALSPGSVVVPSARYLNSRIHGHKPLHGVSHLHVLADSWTIASLSEASKPCSRPRQKVGSGGRVNPPCFYPTHAA